MAQMNISLPEKLKDWVESQVADGNFASSSDYMRDLVRRDRHRREQLDRLRMEIRASFDAPLSETDPIDQLGELRTSIKARATSRNAA